MHRKPQLQDAARKLQEIINSRSEAVSYAQALEIIGQLEGFEGYRQMREFISRHSQKASKAVLAAEPVRSQAKRLQLPVIEPSLDFLAALETENHARTLWPKHCIPAGEELKYDEFQPLSGRRPLETLGAIDFPWESGNRTTVVDLFLTPDTHGIARWQNRLVEIELQRPSDEPDSSGFP